MALCFPAPQFYPKNRSLQIHPVPVPISSVSVLVFTATTQPKLALQVSRACQNVKTCRSPWASNVYMLSDFSARYSPHLCMGFLFFCCALPSARRPLSYTTLEHNSSKSSLSFLPSPYRFNPLFVIIGRS
jgi:hypothetical protein